MSKYITVKQAAEHLGFSESYLNQLRVYGRGPVYYAVENPEKPGRPAIRYTIADLDAWMEPKRTTSTSAA